MNDISYAGKHTVTFTVPRHMHQSWEFIYCTSGSGRIRFESLDLPYEAGTMVVIPPGTPHINESDTGFTNIFANVEDCFLTLRQPFLVRDDANGFLLSAFQALFFHYSSNVRDASLLSAYGNLIATYAKVYQKSEIHTGIVSEIEGHIIQNFPNPAFELDEYLRSLPFSYEYLRKRFKKEVGVTPHQYLSDKRLQTAADWLARSLDDSSNVAEIAHLSGFKEPLYFSRMFKKRYGVAPSFYAEMKKEQTNEVLDADAVKVRLDS